MLWLMLNTNSMMIHYGDELIEMEGRFGVKWTFIIDKVQIPLRWSLLPALILLLRLVLWPSDEAVFHSHACSALWRYRSSKFGFSSVLHDHTVVCCLAWRMASCRADAPYTSRS